MCKRLIYPFFFAMLLSVVTGVQAEPFSLGGVADIEIGNDPQIGPDASTNGSGFGMRDIPDRRRVALISYDISGLIGPGEFFSDVSFSHFSHDQDDEVSVYGVIEDLDLLDVETLTWNTAPGVKNDPAPPLNDPVVLDLDDLTEVLMTFTPPSAVGVRFSTDTSQALADFLNSDTDGIITFLMAASAVDTQTILRSSEHSSGGSLLEGNISALAQMASNPDPDDKETDVCRRPVLSWTPGIYAPQTGGHKVFFSDDFNDVKDGVGGVIQDTNTYEPPGLLDFSTTYYWRIDEANIPTSGWDEGNIWEFTAEPFVYPIENITVTASSNEAGKEPADTVTLEGDLHSTDTSQMWLSASGQTEPAQIKFEFDKPYRLNKMWVWNYNGEGLNLAYGIRGATIEYSIDDSVYVTLGTYEFARATAANDYAHDDYSNSTSGNNEIDFGGVAARYVRIIANSNWSGGMVDQFGLSEVRFFYIPVGARYPSPQDEATDVGPDVVLSWRAGREAAMHEVYFSGSEQAVLESTIIPESVPANGCEPSHDVGTLQLGETYYWKVNEVNDAEIPATWQGDVWRFTTREYLVVDDMESYADANTPGEPGSWIWYEWKDGYGWTNPAPGNHGNGTGSIVDVNGTTVNTGNQSLRFDYSNDGNFWNAFSEASNPYYSEVERTFDEPQNWTKAGIEALTLYFYGAADNDANATEQLYVKVNGAKVTYDGDLSDIRQAQWHEWNIALADFSVDLTNVTKLAIGFGNEASTTPGGLGTVYFDDIRLYPARCILSKRSADLAKADYAPAGNPAGDCVIDCREIELMAEDWLSGTEPSTADQIWRQAESADTMSPPLQIWSDRTDASGGQYIAVEPGNSSGENPPTEGVATYVFTVKGGTYKILGRVIAPTGTDDSFWFNIPTATTQTSNHPSGWIFWDVSEAGGNNWSWDEVNSQDDNDATVQFTMNAGAHTLYVAYREDGALLDRLLITDDLTLNQANLPPRAADISADDRVDFKDFAVLADSWLDERLWP